MEGTRSFEDLGEEDRLSLVRFVCSFAWADLEIRDEERRFVRALVRGLGLGDGERRAAEGWLARPPAPESLDPGSIPLAHRALFLAAAEAVIQVDGEVTPEERESLGILRKILLP